MIQEMTNSEIIRMLGKNFKQYRLIMQMTQREMSEYTGVSISTIHNFESGNATNMTLNNLFSLMRKVGILENVMFLIPEQPESPYAHIKSKIRHATSQYKENKN